MKDVLAGTQDACDVQYRMSVVMRICDTLYSQNLMNQSR